MIVNYSIEDVGIIYLTNLYKILKDITVYN